MKIIAILFLACSMVVAVYCSKKDDAEIINLPGLADQPKFKMYSDYLPASEESQDTFIHYWLVESAGDPLRDPLVLWLSEGPYCSSMIGLLDQTGPFLLDGDGEFLRENEFSWNKRANVLYLDVPFTTGFSYAVNGTTGDKEAGQGLYEAILNFLLQYKSLGRNNMYVAAEGRSAFYALLMGKKLRQNPTISFKGYLLINPATFENLDVTAAIRNLYYKGFLTSEDMLKLYQVCCPTVNVVLCDITARRDEKKCGDAITDAFEVTKYINQYNMYLPLPGGVVLMGARRDKREYYCRERSLDHLVFYLNKDRVREAIHMTNKSRQWIPATIPDNYRNDFKDNDKVAKLYATAFDDKNIRTVMYYGDLNLQHSVYSGEEAIGYMNLIETKPRSPWYYEEKDTSKQLGGFWAEYGNIRFVTVKGAGAYVSEDAPRQAYKIFETFLGNQTL